MQPLNYTPKAIADLMNFPCPGAPLMQQGMRYIAEKLRRAEVFMLPDHGQLLDRSKTRPEVPGTFFKPPFPIVALEYSAEMQDWDEGEYTAAKSSRRIALAWDWCDDLPPALRKWSPTISEPGVVLASICYFNEHQTWMPIPAAYFMPYYGEWKATPEYSPFRDAMIASGRLKGKNIRARGYSASPIGIMPEALQGIAMQRGIAGMEDALHADTMDEINAFMDLSIALGCKNVSTVATPPPDRLNRSRIKAGKPPLKGFHVLQIDGHGELPGHGSASGRGTVRSHLRRGHIRRLDVDRITWVNATIVQGRGGFVDKQYSMKTGASS